MKPILLLLVVLGAHASKSADPASTQPASGGAGYRVVSNNQVINPAATFNGKSSDQAKVSDAGKKQITPAVNLVSAEQTLPVGNINQKNYGAPMNYAKSSSLGNHEQEIHTTPAVPQAFGQSPPVNYTQKILTVPKNKVQTRSFGKSNQESIVNPKVPQNATPTLPSENLNLQNPAPITQSVEQGSTGIKKNNRQDTAGYPNGRLSNTKNQEIVQESPSATQLSTGEVRVTQPTAEVEETPPAGPTTPTSLAQPASGTNKIDRIGLTSTNPVAPEDPATITNIVRTRAQVEETVRAIPSTTAVLTQTNVQITETLDTAITPIPTSGLDKNGSVPDFLVPNNGNSKQRRQRIGRQSKSQRSAAQNQRQAPSIQNQGQVPDVQNPSNVPIAQSPPGIPSSQNQINFPTVRNEMKLPSRQLRSQRRNGNKTDLNGNANGAAGGNQGDGGTATTTILATPTIGILANDLFCAQSGVPLLDGTQKQTSTWSNTVQGSIPDIDQMVSTIILSPKSGANFSLNQEVQINVQTLNMELGFFEDPQTRYYLTPQTLNAQGLIQGHQHVTVQNLSNVKAAPSPNPGALAFFKGLDQKDNNGTLNVVIPANTLKEPGVYRICTITGTRGHQPVIMPVARRGAQDDCIRINVA